MPWDWEECIEEGNKSFEYMVQHFNSMFDGPVIKHFDIRFATRAMMSYCDNDAPLSKRWKELYHTEIENALIPWINEELHSKRLFEYSNWRPCRNPHNHNAMHMGYNKLFEYQEYYFQLAIQYYCGQCHYCKIEENRIHFELALYGCKHELHNILLDLMIPESFWDTE